MDDARVLLASASPRRRALLAQLGVRHTTVAAEVDETRMSGEPPEAYVVRLALAKARAGRAAAHDGAARLVIGADTAVVIDDEILQKPADREAALGMLARLSGRTHRVLTGVAVVGDDREITRFSLSSVSMRVISPEERRAYWMTGEPADKAGAYAVQGLGAMFISRIEGSYSGIVGLPLYETAEMLSHFGIDLLARR